MPAELGIVPLVASSSKPASRFLVVVNPRAGAGRAQALLPALGAALRHEGADFARVLTRGPGDATHRTREALRQGAPGVAVVGGDGTLNEAVNGFFDEGGELVAPGAWLGVLPCGTGGDFRKTLGLSKRPEAMVRHLMRATPRPIDVGWLRFVDHGGEPASRAFLNIASFGIGGLVDRLVNEGPKWIGGTPAFLVGTLRAMLQYRNQGVNLSVDGGPPRATRIVNLAVANGRYFGGGMMIAPRAKIDDGVFDVVGLENLSASEQLRLTRHLYAGSILGQPGVTYVRGSKIHVEPAVPGEKVLLDVDGEAPGMLPATFEIRPGAILLRG